MAGGGGVPVAENLPQRLLRLTGAVRECKAADTANPYTGATSTEPGLSRKQNAEPDDAPGRLCRGAFPGPQPDAGLVYRAMRSALESRSCRTGRLLCHSDQGGQYRSKKYRRLLWQNGVMQSMSRCGNCLDNSPMERVFRSLKSEWIPAGGYRDIRQAM